MTASARRWAGGHAFPQPITLHPASGEYLDAGECVEGASGMSLRDYFVAAALQGALANEIIGTTKTPIEIAQLAMAVAQEAVALSGDT